MREGSTGTGAGDERPGHRRLKGASTLPNEKPHTPVEKNARRQRWDPDTFTCTFKGHVAPGAEVRLVRPQDRVVVMDTADGVRFARCLRCDAWVLADPADAVADRLPDLSEIEVPQRGKALRDALVLKLIAVERALHAVVFALVAVVTLVLELDLDAVQDQARAFLESTEAGVDGTGQEASRSFLVRQLQHVASVQRNTLTVVIISLLAFAALEASVAVGLWRQRRWAEYVTALVTAAFLPLEVHELAERVTVGKVLALAVNLAVLAYLLWAKRLFGIRGGPPEVETQTADALPPLPGQLRDGEITTEYRR